MTVSLPVPALRRDVLTIKPIVVHSAQKTRRKFDVKMLNLQKLFILNCIFCAIIVTVDERFANACNKGAIMDNILFSLIPKAMCAFVYDDFTIRQALEKMESAGYAALPILNKRGEYRGTLTEGDLLWALKNMCYMDMRQAESRRIMEIDRKKDYISVRVTTTMQDLVQRASTQNFVPVVDDKGAFIGIVTRRAIIQFCKQQLFPED